MPERTLAIIPARGGSKGVKRKNIRMVGNKPLIYWSILAAQKSDVIEAFYVTTDDDEIAEVASSFGAGVIRRPLSIADDRTPMIPTLQHAVEQAEISAGGQFTNIVLLQPTAPTRISIDIDQACRLFVESQANSLVSVYLVDDAHPSRMYKIIDNKLVKFYEEPVGALRQNLEDIYHRNGALYICKRDVLMNENTLVTDCAIPFIMPKERSFNIDDELDLKIADFILSDNENTNP